MALALLGVATVSAQVDSPVDQEMLEQWKTGEYCAGLFDGSVPEFDTVSVGRYDTDELPIEELKEQCKDWCFLYSDQEPCCFYFVNDFDA